ncbi:MAG: ankyrin repeat domain-containing protein [Candidatus Amoebophilus sp.]
MKRFYTINQQFIACLLLVSLFLQSCGGGFDNNPLIPIEENQIAHIQTDTQAIIPPTNIQPLFDQALIAQGGHTIMLYEEAGKLKADVEVNAPQGFSQDYKGLAVALEHGTQLSNLSQLSEQAQQRRIHLQPAHAGKPAKIVIYKGAGLAGGMLEGEGEASEDELADENIPEECFCPITQEIMEDPVIAQDGHTYERAAIKRWLGMGKRTSPKTGARLLSTELIANYTMRSLIQDIKSQVPVLARHKLDMHNIEVAIKLREEEIEEKLAQKGHLVEKESQARLNLENELQQNTALVGIMEQRIKSLEQQVNSFISREKELEERLLHKERLVKKESEVRLNLAAALEQKDKELAKQKDLLDVMEQRLKVLEERVNSSKLREEELEERLIQKSRLVQKLNKRYALYALDKGSMYYHGKGVAKDYIKALKWYQKAADQGHARAQCNLGMLYHQGHGIAKDYIKALEWYGKSANQGYAQAQYELGWCYANGRGAENNDKRVVEWYQKAAEQGYAPAQHNLGWMYLNGRGVEKDDRKAVEWYQKAANQGLADAQYSLGVMYGGGRGITKDEKKAVKWYQRAAKQGHARAQYNLGIMYGEGRSITKDERKAFKWVQKAANQGHVKAQSILERDNTMRVIMLQMQQCMGRPLSGQLIPSSSSSSSTLGLNGNQSLKENDGLAKPELPVLEDIENEGVRVERNIKKEKGKEKLKDEDNEIDDIVLLEQDWKVGEDEDIQLQEAGVKLAERLVKEEKYPLHKAYEVGNLEAVKYLLEKGADIQAKDIHRRTPLHCACEKGDLELVKYLLLEKGANIHATDEEGGTPLLCACDKGHLEVVKYLVEKGADVNDKEDNDNTSLHYAAWQGHLEVVKYLVEKGADIHTTDQYRDTPLLCACDNDQLEVVKYLIEKGADVNAKGQYGQTTLHWACRQGYLEAVKYLVEKGANIHATDNSGNTPLNWACRQGYLEAVKYLVEKGADVNAKTKWVTEFEYEYGYSEHEYVEDKYDYTPLLCACENDHLEVVKYLIEKGADINAKNQKGETPINIARQKKYKALVNLLTEKLDA